MVFPLLLSQGRRYSGTLNGQYGEFVCYVRCSATINFFSDRVEMTDGNLLFIPITRTPSADHLTYGSWLQASNDAANVTQYAFGSFADGNDPFEQGRLAPLTGTATYRGDARGVYFDSEDAEDSYFFDALVTLTANFGSGSELGTIGGRVHDFVTLGEFDDYRRSSSTGRTAVDGNPTLTLGSADIGSSNSGFFEGETSGTYDGSAFSGRWGGRFYGNGDGSFSTGLGRGYFRRCNRRWIPGIAGGVRRGKITGGPPMPQPSGFGLRIHRSGAQGLAVGGELKHAHEKLIVGFCGCRIGRVGAVRLRRWW